MLLHRYVVQPSSSQEYRSLFKTAFEEAEFSQFDAAVAYATRSGVEALRATFTGKLASNKWDSLAKRWLVGIDWLRTEPVALEALSKLKNSNVRIHDGKAVVARVGCTPRIPFHPKTYILSGPESIALIIGSGNLSRNGLVVGHEVGSLLVVRKPLKGDEEAAWNAAAAVKRWFDGGWKVATASTSIERLYAARYESAGNLRAPTPTDEDSAPSEELGTRHGFTADQLRQLRAARFFWIQAGRLHENLGPGRPGNQLMLRRMTRVFFGFPAIDLPRDSHVGEIEIECNGTITTGRTIRFSNNSMDVLALPLLNSPGPAKYDEECLLFEKRPNGIFRLTVCTAAQEKDARRRSVAASGLFRMSSGREFGVY